MRVLIQRCYHENNNVLDFLSGKSKEITPFELLDKYIIFYSIDCVWRYVRHKERTDNMQNIFVTKLHINEVRHLKDVNITLSDTERKHLIITGKNGSGKTSLLEALRNVISCSQLDFDDVQIDEVSKIEKKYPEVFINFPPKKPELVSITYSKLDINFYQTMFAYIPASRTELDVPKSIEFFEMLGNNLVMRMASNDFLKYILLLDYQLYSAKSEDDKTLENKLTNWFDNFTTALRTVYDCQELMLKRDTKNLSFKIEMPGRKPFALNEMADGYAAFLGIYMELIMRMESADGDVDYCKPAIVMIDEIEAHLHVELQKRALPFLTEMFPNTQFIVTTHSPFIITSIENAVVFDLETKRRVHDLHTYSWDTIVESYFDINQYSLAIEKN